MSIRTKQSPAGETEQGMEVKMEAEVVERERNREGQESEDLEDRSTAAG